MPGVSLTITQSIGRGVNYYIISFIFFRSEYRIRSYWKLFTEIGAQVEISLFGQIEFEITENGT